MVKPYLAQTSTEEKGNWNAEYGLWPLHPPPEGVSIDALPWFGARDAASRLGIWLNQTANSAPMDPTVPYNAYGIDPMLEADHGLCP